jgi:hypothetical protein
MSFTLPKIIMNGDRGIELTEVALSDWSDEEEDELYRTYLEETHAALMKYNRWDSFAVRYA